MLENIRENSQGVIAKIILGFIILTFAVAGIGSYTNSVDTSVAEVNGEKISQRDFEKAYQNQRNRMAQQYGDMFETLAADANYMASLRSGVLENLINEKLIVQSTNELAIRISDEKLKKTIREMKEFHIDGVFDNNRYIATINQAGFFQSSDFRDYMRVDMARRQLSQALVSSEFNLPYQSEILVALQNQQRDIKFATISSEQFKSSIEVSEDEITTYYQENQARFANKEKVKLDYVLVDVEDIAKSITLTEKDIETYYQENIANYKTAEQRKVSHILIEFGDDDAAAEQKINALLTRVNNGEDFAELAKTESADTFSGENGGDLDWIEPGVMDPAFDEAAFALTDVNGVSGVVKTAFGFHIIKLTELKPEVVQSLEDMRDEIIAKASNDMAQEKYYELQQELARVSFEFPDSLDDAATAVDSEVKTTEWLSKTGNMAPFDNVALLDVAFSDLVLLENLNSDIVEISDTQAIVVRLNEHQPADIKPLESVKDEINTLLVSQKATEMAQTKADELLALVKESTDVTAQLTEIGASFETKANVGRYGSEVDNAIVREAFVLPHPSEGAISAATTTLGNGDLAIVEVTAVSVADVPENPNMAQQLTSQLSQEAYKNYIDALKAEATIKRRVVEEPANVF